VLYPLSFFSIQNLERSGKTMAQLGIGLSQEQRTEILNQVKDLIQQIESNKVDLKLDNNINKQIEDIKNQLNNVSENIKPIDFQINTEKSKEQLAKIKGDFDKVIEGLTSNGKILDLTPSFNKNNGALESFTVKLQEAEGLIEKISIKSSMDGQNGILTPTGNFNIEKITEYDNRIDITNQKLQELQKMQQSLENQNQKEAQQQENQALQESLNLLKQDYDLEKQINIEKQKGNELTIQTLQTQKVETESKFANSSSGLNNNSQNVISDKAVEYQNQLNIQTSQLEDKENQIQETLQKQVQTWQDQKTIAVQRLEQSNQEAIKNKEIQTQLAEMKATIAGMGKDSNGGFDKNFDTAKLTEANIQLKQLQANVAGYNSELRNSSNVFSNLLEQTGKFASWMISATVLMQAINGIKDMVSNVETLDSQLTQLSYVSNMSTEQMKNFANSEIEVSKDLGANVESVREASRIFTNLNATSQQVLENTKAATAFANVTGTDIESSASDLQAVTNQFTEMQGKTMQAGDAITKVSANLSMDFETASKNIAQAVKTSGSAMD
jgi:DNA repair exonuclease SbcCD ATPase subunit